MTEQRMSLLDTIKPKSDQLNADDLLTGPITVEVVTLKRGDADQPVAIVIKGIDGTEYQPYKPCKSVRRVLISAWGDKGKDWIGKRMTLYQDPDVKWGGQAVGGIRVSHMSGIDGPLTLKLTVTRGKRVDYTVQPLTEKGGAA